jgi:RNA methyltransferase, TrmH family
VVVVEGAELLATALAAGASVESVYVAPGDRFTGGPVDLALSRGARVFDLAPGVIERVADTVHPQPVVSIVRFAISAIGEVPPRTADALVLVCAEVRDPGNAGTVIRTADAVGASAVVFANDTVDPTNPKVVRASAGSIFHLPVIEGGPVLEVIWRLREDSFTTVGTLARGGTDYVDFDWRQPVAVVLGNEAGGLTGAVIDALDAAVTVPLAGQAESLNVSTAAAVVCFEARRQRLADGGHRSRSTGPGAQGSTISGMEATGTAGADRGSGAAGPGDG